MSPLLYSREEGEGPTLLLLHGFCETHEIWNDFTEPLARQFKVIALDLPGFGQSEILPGTFTIDDVGDAVANWLKERHLGKATTIGHSLGGYVALSLAKNHPQLVSGLGLFHSTVFADSDEKKENRDKVIAFVRKNGVQPFIDTFVPGLFLDKSHPMIEVAHRIAMGTKPETLISYSKAMRDRPDRSSTWQNDAIPKLMIAGADDVLVPMNTSREMAKMAKNLSFFELRNAAHMGFFEAKTECQEIIRGFTYELQFNK
jgi:pimeloyl-ACP methyl ester carboxylesterase